jgi:WD40 repeat protein
LFIGVSELINDYNKLLSFEISNKEKEEALEILFSSLKQAAQTLKIYPNQLNSQLIGFIENGKNLFLDTIIQAIKENPKGVWLRPILASLPSQQGQLINIFRGHSKWVSTFEVIKEDLAISSDMDGVIKLWNIEDGECYKQFLNKNDKYPYTSLKKTKNYVLSEYYFSTKQEISLSVWDIEREKLLKQITLEGLNPKRNSKKNKIDITPCENFVLTEEYKNENNYLNILKIPSLESHQKLKS